MKKFSYYPLVLLMAMPLLSSSAFAANPFDEKITVKIDNNGTNTETFEIKIKVNDTKSDDTKLDDSNKKNITFPIKGSVTASALNIRTSPWGEIIDVYDNGEQVEIIGQVGDWYKVNYNGKICYIHGDWVSTSENDDQTGSSDGVVSCGYGVNIHRTPSGDVLGPLGSGEQVKILGEVGDWYKIQYNNNEAFVSKNYIDLVDSNILKNESNKNDTESNSSSDGFTAYITADSLNIRSSAWGEVEGTLGNGEQVKVIGKVGDWYQIDYNGETKYVYADFVSTIKPTSSSNTGSANTGNAVSASDGSLQQRIVNAARDLVGSTDFRGPEVNYGSVACAQVVSTALNNAGAISEDQMSLDCYVLRDNMLADGWEEVSPPPYQEGDVVFWSTYDWDGDGVIDDDTHVGIVLKEGDTYTSMNNSSDQAMPIIRSIDYFDVSRVLRKK